MECDHSKTEFGFKLADLYKIVKYLYAITFKPNWTDKLIAIIN